MAEIGIEKKKPIWPWIILVLVILAILYFLVFADNDDDNMDENNTEQVEEPTTGDDQARGTTGAWDTNDTSSGNYGQAVSGYISHVGDKSRMGIDHEYTNNALLQLINAVQAKARENNVNIDADIQQIRQNAEEITQNPQATDHADKIKEAGTNLANALEKIQKEKFPNLSQDVQEVKNAAQEIDSSTLTLEQKEDVNSFFDEAADVLQKMS